MASREPEALPLARGRVVNAEPLWHDGSAADAATCEDVRRIVREELRKCGLRPPCPEGLAHRWDAESDSWVPTA